MPPSELPDRDRADKVLVARGHFESRAGAQAAIAAGRVKADGQVIRKARFVKVSLNGETIHEDVEMSGPTPGGLTGKEHAKGPILLQGDHGPVSYRNLKVTRMVFQTLQAN